MALIVQKFGGTSVADLERIRLISDRVKESYDSGNKLIIVVSARAGVTNRLIADAKQLNKDPDRREMDMLLSIGEQETIALMAISLQGLGVPAVSRTGSQAGIITDFSHQNARIIDISGGDILEQLDEGKVVIVAGFQGANSKGQITTFGRGGSDLTAVALAANLKADYCQIFTDVEGVYTADPKIVPDAKKIDEITYDEMLELASLGAKVMQSRSVEFAKKQSVNFEVRSSFNNKPGTIVKEEIKSMEDVVVRGVAVDKNQVKVVVGDLPDKPGTAAQIFKSLDAANVNVDMIIQNIGREGSANLTFTVAADDADRAEKAMNDTLSVLGCGRVNVADRIAKISIVGVGMRSHSGVASKMFSTLADLGVNIQLISTSEIKISIAIDVEKAEVVTRAIHNAFELEK